MAKYTTEDLNKFPQESLLAPGPYVVNIAKATLGKSQSSGRPVINITYKVVSGPTQENDVEPAGATGFMNLYFAQADDKPGTKAMMMRRINGLVSSLEDAPDEIDDEDGEWLEDVVDQDVGVRFYHKKDKDSGEVRLEIKNFFPASELDD